MKKKKINSLLRRSHEATRCSWSIRSKIMRRSRSRRPSLKTSKKFNNNNNSCLFLKLLPVEIAADIFSRLPFDSVLQCKLVCKTWRDFFLIIADHHHSNINNNNNNNSIVEKTAGGFLLRLHYKKPGFYYGEYDEKQQVPPTYKFNLTKKAIFNHQYHPFQDIWNWYVVGSCNGLICLRRRNKPAAGTCTSSFCEHETDRHDMYVCNPYTGEYVKLPNPTHGPRLLDHVIPSHEDGRAYGFGYHPITKEYKVIRIYYQHDFMSNPTSVHVQVYTLGRSDTCAWRSIGEIKHKLYRSFQWENGSDNTSWGILLNGALYWLTENAKHIVSFDLADEEFRDISTTPPPDFHGPSVLGVLNGCLCFSTGMDGSTRIWVMNNNDYCWSKKFSISWGNNNFRPDFPLAHLESGNILLHCDFNRFFSYDPETEHAVELKMRGSFFFDIIPYMKSTVSLKALGEKEAIQVTAI